MQRMRRTRDLKAKLATRWLSASMSPRFQGAVVLLSICVLPAIFNSTRSVVIAHQVVPFEAFRSAPFRATPDYSNFQHSTPSEHAALMGPKKCASCHRASGALAPSFPRHKDCTGCHLIQFTAANSGSTSNPICTICHDEKDLSSSKTSPREFPPLRSFAAKFDHAQHLQGIDSARPQKNCNFCHTQARGGVAETIPARLEAHRICYECHAPGKQASESASCGSCHDQRPYSATAIAARSYRVGFSHAEHGPRERLNCESCHTLLGRGLAQTRQVSSIAPALHRSNARARSCLTCHNGRRAFGDAQPEFVNCKRCHNGPTFKS